MRVGTISKTEDLKAAGPYCNRSARMRGRKEEGRRCAAILAMTDHDAMNVEFKGVGVERAPLLYPCM